MPDVTALDIGGANVKAVDRDGTAYCWRFPLWKEHRQLAAFLAARLRSLGCGARLVVTMTGELCDAYASKAAGVRTIVRAVREAAHGVFDDVRVWRVDGRFASPEAVEADPLPAAAANWLALASFAAPLAGASDALVVDIGSTTSDLVPIRDGRPAPAARTDSERLLARELVYTGVGRTAIAAVVRALPFRGALCPVSAELFATTRDVYLLLGALPEAPGDRDTADGRPATRRDAARRLARMVCADADDLDDSAARRAAEHVRDAQIVQLRAATEHVMAGWSPRVAFISGSGEFLAREVLAPYSLGTVSLGERLGAAASIAACAYALRELALREEG